MKKFLIQVVVLLTVVFAGLIAVFRPTSVGLPSVIPGGGYFDMSASPVGSTNPNPASQLLFIDANSTGNPELVKSVITVEIADDPAERGKGLSYRDVLDQNSGMMFVFDNSSRYRFIMTGMRFPLDFLWIQNDKIVDILENIPPDPAQKPEEASHFYQPVTEVNKVVEVNAGYIKAHNLKVGDRIKLQ